jgi:hypothetical protein
MADYFVSSEADAQLELRLDRSNSDFGLVIKATKTSQVIAKMVQLVDETPVYFHASWAASACYSPHIAETTVSAKVSVRLPNCQVDMVFETYAHAVNMLTTLKRLATTSFMLYPVPP